MRNRTTLMHDEHVDHLEVDPRTRSLEGARSSRRQLAKLTSDLFAELRPDESVSWVMTSNQLPVPGLALITNQRLLMLPLIPGKRIRQAAAPFRVDLGKKRLVGQVVEVTNAEGAAVNLLLATDEDVTRLRAAAGTGGPSTFRRSPRPTPAQPPTPAWTPTQASGASYGTPPADAAVNHLHETGARQGEALPLGGWRWGHPVLTWQDAEQLAADHMRALRFRDVLVTPPGRDGGLDVVAPTAGAQVKYMAMPTGSPDVQRLAGAAHEFTHKLFYATAYSTSALAQADVLAIALFQYDTDGNVAPVNAAARNLGNRTPDPVPKRNVFGQLDFEGRQMRVLRWAQEVRTASETPISNRKRKGAKQLAEKEQALTLMMSALALLEDSNNPLYKRRRKEKTLEEAEKTLKAAARLARVILR
jgi:hypothetical protein